MRILFLGEGDPQGPARYFLAIAKHSKFKIDHRPDRVSIPIFWRRRDYDVVVLSDYRHRGFSKDAEQWLIAQVQRRGVGLLMIGGWASFTGNVGHYAGTRIESLLPVRCVTPDDRVNIPGGAFLTPLFKDSFANLDWNHPPIVCGYHRVHVQPNSETWLAFRDVRWQKDRISLGVSHSALVVGKSGEGRTAAFLTDCAPHWAGGLVDWGKKRVQIRLSAGNTVEVGDAYLALFDQLLRRLAKRGNPPPRATLS